MNLPSHNTPWTELEIGATASLTRPCHERDVLLFAHVSGNLNPLHLAEVDPSRSPVPAMWVGSLVSAVLGNILPGPGTLYRNQHLNFHQRTLVGDTLSVTVQCTHKGSNPEAGFRIEIRNQNDELVCDGSALVEAPSTRVAISHRDLPTLIMGVRQHFNELIDQARTLGPMRTVVVCPEDDNSLGGAILSAQQGLIIPVLVGDPQRIAAAAANLGADISAWDLVPVSEHAAAAAKAIELARSGLAHAVMKGAIHSDTLLSAIINRDHGLRTTKRLSHVFAMDVPSLNHLLFISDAAINISPDLNAKVDITQNAIDVARACGIEQPRVGILSAIETINPHIPSSLDAAVISKMAERGQIQGGIVDGPLAMDNAIDLAAARTKGIQSLVAGRAQVLIVPNLESGNMLAKELTFIAGAQAAGVVVGARVPVILTSRADNDRARVASSALARLHDHWQQSGRLNSTH